MKTLTVFTPTYNRAHTLRRLYESLCTQTCDDFEWLVIDDGSTDFTRKLVEGFIQQQRIPIRYIYKENGGLHTGYNTAYENIETELSVCIDSDDFMPDDAVGIIVTTWKEKGSDKYLGLIGLDFSYDTMEPIGGYFLMKQVSPQIGFPDEKYFNPVYSLLKIGDAYPLLVINANLCIVDYQTGRDSISGIIFKQYVESPKSFAKLRILEMQLKHNSFLNKCRCAIHYVSSCHISNIPNCISNSPLKIITVLMYPIGLILALHIKKKASQL